MQNFVSLPTIGYGVGAAAFFILALMLLTVWRGRLRGSFLLVACLATVVWGVVLALVPVALKISAFHVFLTEILIDGVWLLFLASLMRGAVVSEQTWLLRFGGLILVAILLVIGIVLEIDAAPGELGAGEIFIMGALATTLYGLVGVEQIYRNARQSQQNGLKFLALGIGAFFGYDLFLYSNAFTTGAISEEFWNARGFVVALCAPLIAVSASRSPSWAPGLFVSRKVIFYTTTLIAAGIYLFAVGVIGYYIQNVDARWGPTAQLVFFATAVIAFLIFLLSDQTRARIRVFFAKHFFENKYDYREEWLRLITTLTGTQNRLPLKKRAIKALADILDVRSGVLWYRDLETEVYVPLEGWGVTVDEGSIDSDSSLIRFLRQSEWVIDLRELRREPSRYESLDASEASSIFGEAAFVCPLVHEDDLVGFVVLDKPNTPVKLNFEDHDLLKTAGHQIASYLEQASAADRLSEVKQFEAFNKLTAYIMHDLKNAIAQQSLVVENAKKHKRNPEFIDDAMETISSSVVRMKRVISHLRQGKVELLKQKVNVPDILRKAVTSSRDRLPRPELTVTDGDIYVEADEDRLLMAVCHAIRNAQDATGEEGQISVSGHSENGRCIVRISDTGGGMDSDFIRRELFKPFETSKGVEGMGIGAYQIRETIRAAGGDVEVDSRLGEGTTFILNLPLVGT